MALCKYAEDLCEARESDEELSINPAEDEFQKRFYFPRSDEPKVFLQKCEKAGISINFNRGTTTLAFVYDGGVIVAVDSRATAGPYIASQSVKKVIEINPFLLGTMAGGAADCSFWERVLSQQCRLFELRNGFRITVSAASKILANMVHEYKNMGLSMGTMICGWDIKGPSVYYVEDSGARMTSHLFSVGSGSTYAYGILDSLYRSNMTDEEAIELGKRAIYHATYRDAMSGGQVNVYHVGPNGWRNIGGFNVIDLHDIYKNPYTYSMQ